MSNGNIVNADKYKDFKIYPKDRNSSIVEYESGNPYGENLGDYSNNRCKDIMAQLFEALKNGASTYEMPL